MNLYYAETPCATHIVTTLVVIQFLCICASDNTNWWVDVKVVTNGSQLKWQYGDDETKTWNRGEGPWGAGKPDGTSSGAAARMALARDFKLDDASASSRYNFICM